MRTGTIIAFKPKDRNIWYTGMVAVLKDAEDYLVDLILPIEPQWYEEGDKTVYRCDEILQHIILEA